MVSKTKELGRADILVRMSLDLKSRVIQAAADDGVTNNDWLLDVIERAVEAHEAEVTAETRKADLEQRLDLKFEEIVSYLAAKAKVGDRIKLSADKLAELHKKAESAIEKWQVHAASNYGAEPRTLLERLCKDHCDIEEKIEEIDRGARPDNRSEIDPLDFFGDLFDADDE
jgi:hypothetical protein